MMKKICASLLLAMGVTAFSACGSDDPEAAVPVARDYKLLTVQTDNGVGTPWSEGDSLTVYTLASKSHYRYDLTAGAGAAKGTFTLNSAPEAFNAEARCYALTATHNMYGISAADGGNTKLTYELPDEYEAEELSVAGGSFLMNAPAWGELAFDAQGKPSATLRALTAFLKVDLSAVPDDAQCILVTTHNDFRLNGVSMTGCAGEPLAGYFDCVLTDGATLLTDARFKYGDVIRIELDEDWQLLDCLYVPLPVGSYEQVQVVASSELFYRGYEWEGELVATHKGLQLSLNTVR